MRDQIRNAVRRLRTYPDHAGLAHDVWARLDKDGKPDDGWLDAVTDLRAPSGYERSVERWKELIDPQRDCHFSMSTQGRLLVGHGNPALTEVGITLHRTWGVPVIPGSALKGLLAHHIAACYGATVAEIETDKALDDRRLRYASNQVMETLLDKGVYSEPRNAIYRRLFGAPEFTGPDGAVHHACRGELTVHDALWMPDGDKPLLARDVLTVHHRNYYQGGACPNDHENPTPVSFVSVPPGARFLFTLSCDHTDLLGLAAARLIDALEQWGVGGKTAAGYGRLRKDSGKVQMPEPPDPPDVAAFRRWMDTSARDLSVKQLARAIQDEWLARLCALDNQSRSLAATIIKSSALKPKQYRPLLKQISIDS